MPTIVRELMHSPPCTCSSDVSLAEATVVMDAHQVGSVLVTDGHLLVGILTERDVLRASAQGVDYGLEVVRSWMTPDPDVIAGSDRLDTAWAGISGHHYRHLPVVDDGDVIGVVSMRDLLAVGQLHPSGPVPRGLAGVVVSETSIGDVDGERGFFHYRQYSATALAAVRSFEDVWYLMIEAELPGRSRSEEFAAKVANLRSAPPSVRDLLSTVAHHATTLDALRTSISALGGELGWRPSHDVDHRELCDQALRLGAVMPTLVAAAHRLRLGEQPVPPRTDLSVAANYLWMLRGQLAPAEHVRALEQYLILTIDHGFNASTFAARVIASTGADMAAAIVGAIGALSGPLHGGAPSRALDMLDAIGTPERAETWVRDAIDSGDRIMGFGHRVYKTNDPRSVFLRDVALRLGGDLVAFAREVERTAVDVLAERKPGRALYTNVEFFAGVVMDACGIPRELFTPTFAIGRTVGWTAHVVEQAADNRLIRPAARYVGPSAPQRVPRL